MHQNAINNSNSDRQSSKESRHLSELLCLYCFKQIQITVETLTNYLRIMKHMKKLGLLLLIAFIIPCTSFAQGEVQSGSNSTYWTDETQSESDGKILNKTKFGDNWFFGIEAGTLFNWGTKQSEHDIIKRFRPMGAIQLGKWMSPSIGARIQGFFGNNSDVVGANNAGKYNWNTIGGYLDGMFNLTNMFCGYKESRGFNLIGLLGVGCEYTQGFCDHAAPRGVDTKEQEFLGGRVGLMAKFRLGEKCDLDIEATNAFLDDHYDGQINSNKLDGHINILNLNKFDNLNSEVNRLQGDLNAARNRVVYETHTIDGSRVNTFIAFDDNSAKIDKLQEVNVFTAAEEMKKLANDGDLYITVNSEEPSKNNELFLQRAQAIRDVLVNQYNIPAGRIFVESNPAVVASLDKNKKCVVVLINE